MTRLPINFLLYTCSLGLGLGCGWTFYQTISRNANAERVDLNKVTTARLDRGKQQTPDDQQNDYSTAAADNWWKLFETANFVGKLPPKPVDAVEQAKPVEVPLLKTPIEDILTVAFIVLDTTGVDSMCVVRYKPEADVQPPEDAVPPKSGTSYTGPQDQIQPNRRAGRGRGARAQSTQQPTFPGSDAPVQYLRIGDSLWPKYEHIKLAKIGDDGRSVYFSRETGETNSGGEGESGEVTANEDNLEILYRDELELGQDVLRKLHEGGVSQASRLEPEEEAAPVQRESRWLDVAETGMVEPGHWVISKKDNSFIGENAQQVFSEDLGIQSYSSRGGEVRGLQVTRVSGKLAQFGVQAGDVILELNGKPVGGSRAKALKLGKDLYKSGVRDFRAKIMTRYGQIEERTYSAPN